jgi:molybdopterin-guanine dinucleotide biosynthesis protein
VKPIEAFIGVVGPCGSGKTTLVKNLRTLGYRCKVIAQEHSYVPDMWLRITHPDILLFLEASYQVTMIRKRFVWTEKEYQEQIHRLRHAKAHANWVIDTDQITAEDVCSSVLKQLPSLIKNRQSQ